MSFRLYFIITLLYLFNLGDVIILIITSYQTNNLQTLLEIYRFEKFKKNPGRNLTGIFENMI